MSIDKLPAAPQHPGASDDERAEAARHVAKSRSGNWFKDHKGITAATSAVAGVALAAAVGMGLKGGGNDAPRHAEHTAAATAEPTETPVESLKPGVGVEGTTYETVNTSKAQEFVEEALKPIPSTLPEEEAIVEFGEHLNIYYNSGEVGSDLQETTLSKATGEQLLNVLFTTGDYVSQQTRGSRHAIARGFYYLNEDGAAPDGKTGTYHISYNPVEQLPDGWYRTEVKVETNFYDLDAAFFQDCPIQCSSNTFTKIVKPYKLGDRYEFTELLDKDN